jgi:hypothetical protein
MERPFVHKLEAGSYFHNKQHRNEDLLGDMAEWEEL